MYIYINRFGWIQWIVSFFKSSSEDVQVFLLLRQVGKEKTWPKSKKIIEKTWTSSLDFKKETIHCIQPNLFI